MCLYTTQEIPTIAKKDIICYKVICKDMSSLFHNDFKWTFGKMYYSWMEAVNNIEDCDKEIHQAFHSYETLEDLKKAYFSATCPCLTVKCTIPKGSEFYKGTHDDLKGYASNQLIINEVIGIKELYPDFDWDNYPFKVGQAIQVKMPHIMRWHDIIYSGEQVKFHDKSTWEDYQITNIQPCSISSTRVDLIVENCDTLKSSCIMTNFDGVAWVTDMEVRLKDNKEG